MVEDAGAAAVTIHGRTAEQSYSGVADWDLVARVAEGLRIPVLGSGDCIEPEQVVDRMHDGVSGVLVGRGVLRNPWILRQAADLACGRPPHVVSPENRGQFLLEYISLLFEDGSREADGFRHVAPGPGDTRRAAAAQAPAGRSRERWVVNKVRALCAWYSKGLDGGSQLRLRVNSVQSVSELRDVIGDFFLEGAHPMPPFEAS
jgi:tRNA-dihydrouridine synthase